MESYGERQDATRLADIREDHRQRYLWARERMGHGGRVLDAACGTGYGSRILSETANSVIGVDLFSEAVEFARRHWQTDTITYAVQDLHFLQFPEDQAFDAVTAFECIETPRRAGAFLVASSCRLHAADAALLLHAP